MNDELTWFGTEKGETAYSETADFWTPFRSPKREEGPKVNSKWGKWPVGRRTYSLCRFLVSRSPGAKWCWSPYPWPVRSKSLAAALSVCSVALPWACLRFSSEHRSPSGSEGQQQPAVQVDGHSNLPCGSLCDARIFINSPFIKLSSDFPIWHVFWYWYWTKWDWERMAFIHRVQILKWDVDLGKKNLTMRQR